MDSPAATIELKAGPGIRYLSVARTLDKLSRKKSWLYYTMKTDPTFPRPLRLGAWPVFVETQIDEWVAQSQPAKSE